MDKKSGQAIPLDFAFGLFIFMLLLVYFIIQWNLFANQFADLAVKGSLDQSTVDTAEMLVHSPGTPFNWTQAPLAAQSIGFAPRQNVLDWGKVAAFSSLSYANEKKLLGTDYDFLVLIETPDGARFATIGLDTSSTRAAEVTRVAILNDTTVWVKVKLYEQ